LSHVTITFIVCIISKLDNHLENTLGAHAQEPQPRKIQYPLMSAQNDSLLSAQNASFKGNSKISVLLPECFRLHRSTAAGCSSTTQDVVASLLLSFSFWCRHLGTHLHVPHLDRLPRFDHLRATHIVSQERYRCAPVPVFGS
jgi:hypothetical protein